MTDTPYSLDTLTLEETVDALNELSAAEGLRPWYDTFTVRAMNPEKREARLKEWLELKRGYAPKQVSQARQSLDAAIHQHHLQANR